MRAIDGDALRDRLQNLGYDDWNQGTTTTWAEAFNECADMVDEQPTIEPQRKRGRWIKKTIKKKIENDYSCSECGRHVSVMRGYDVRLVYPFCHCGAEMTEGEE